MRKPSTVSIGGQTFRVRYTYHDGKNSRIVIDPREWADELATKDNPHGDDFLVTQVQITG